MINKVVHLVYSFGCGGLEKVIVNLINGSKQYDVEHIIISLTDDVAMQDQLLEETQVHVLNKKSGNDISTHFKLFNLLKELKPQVINTYNFGTIEYHLIAKIAGVPIRVHSDHGRGGDDPQGKNKLHNVFRKFISHFITEYVVVSYDLFQWVSKDLKINEQKLSLIFNGVDIPNDINYKEKEPEKFVTVGRLDKVKNQKFLINTFAYAIKNIKGFEHCKLNIVGDGPLYNELSTLIESLNAQDSIKFLGFRDDIPAILSDSDVFVLSSVYEAMPMTILEAMANKVPVVCTNVGGISQFITEQQAWFVESGNVDELAAKLNRVKGSADERAAKIENAYQLVLNNYALEQMVKVYMNKYHITLTN